MIAGPRQVIVAGVTQTSCPTSNDPSTRPRGANEFHGVGGPLWVEEVTPEEKLELADLFVEAAIQTGLPFNRDFNGPEQEGAGSYQLNIRQGRRQSTARTYLKLCQDRPNLTIVTGALTQRILSENGRATGVEYRIKQGKGAGELLQARASAEVILCGGVINSPQLLELSGIGQRERLESLGIDVIKDLPGVGENLQDHLTINVQQALHGVTTFFEETRPFALARNLFKYLFRRRGLLAHPAAQVGVFFRTSDEVSTPDAQVHFAPAASEADNKGNLKTIAGTTATVCHLRPESRGSVHIRSRNPDEAPAIEANYLSTENDRRAMVAAVRRVRKIFAAPALDSYREKELLPGEDRQTDEEILSYVRANAESVYHPIGTCKMGQDELSVVDERLRVHGIDGLRVADASIMPTIVSGNTNAPAIMIAEKCADMLLQDAGVRVHTPVAETVSEPVTKREQRATSAATID